MPFPFPELHNFQNSCLYHEDEDIYVEDATKVESIGKIIMEKYDLLKKLQQNLQNPVSGPDAHSSVNSIIYNIVNTVIRAATGINTSGAGS